MKKQKIVQEIKIVKNRDFPAKISIALNARNSYDTLSDRDTVHVER